MEDMRGKRRVRTGGTGPASTLARKLARKLSGGARRVAAAVLAAGLVAANPGKAEEAAGAPAPLHLAELPVVHVETVTQPAEPSSYLDLSYEFYGGGFRILTLATQAILSEDRYEIASQMKTEGVLDKLFGGRLTSRALGELTPAGPRPTRFENDYVGMFGERNVVMTFEPDGSRRVEANPPLEIEEAPRVSAAVRETTFDPLTASVYTALIENDEPCATTLPIFDGRQVFDLDFEFKGETDLSPSDDSHYGGPAYYCEVRFRPVAGFSRKARLNMMKNPVPPFKVWLARFGEEEMLLPVRLMAESNLGSAVAHLTQAAYDGRDLMREGGRP